MSSIQNDLPILCDKDEDGAKAQGSDSVKIQKVKEELSEFLIFKKTNKQEEKEEGANKTEDNNEKKTKVTKRKNTEEHNSLELLTGVFLRILYPLSSCMGKNIVTGIIKSQDFTPGVVLINNQKSIMFNKTAWESLNKYIQLIECYLNNKVFGRKTCIILANCNIEVENVRLRGEQIVRFKDLTKHDGKIQLNYEEFYRLSSAAPSINRYIEQLVLLEPVIKDYLIDTVNNQPNAPLLHAPLDGSIYNRLPQEVHLYRRMKDLKVPQNGLLDTVDEDEGMDDKKEDKSPEEQVSATSSDKELQKEEQL